MCRRHFPWAQIHTLTENVASMDYQDCQVMNEAFEEQPWFVDATGISLSRRPRLYLVEVGNSWREKELRLVGDPMEPFLSRERLPCRLPGFSQILGSGLELRQPSLAYIHDIKTQFHTTS